MAISAGKRNEVAQRAQFCCEYCQSQLKYSADSFSVEHIIPLSRGGHEEISNLALSCQRCNNSKYVALESMDPLTGRTVPLFHPRDQAWADHFAWSHDFLFIYGITPTGRATVERLQLNRPGVVNLRHVLRSVGEHPPSLS
jgi:hypothetical protein